MQPLDRNRPLCTGLLALACLLLSACRSDTTPQPDEIVVTDGTRVADFPPARSGAASGADSATRATAQALGRGVNFGDMLESPAQVDWVLQVKEEYIQAAKSAGFATVRLPVRWSYHAQTTAPYAIDPAFFALVDQMVDALLAADLNVVLNVHHYRQLNGAQPDTGEATVEADKVDVRFLALWQQIARRYADRSPKLLFEILNEPDGRLDAARWNDLQLRAVQLIRRSNPQRILLLAPSGSNTQLDALQLPNDRRLIATIHHYEPFTFTHQGAEWVGGADAWLGTTCCDAAQTEQIVAPLQRAEAWSQTNGYPVYLGEFGAYGRADMASRVNFTRLLREQAEQRGMSWAYWELASGFGVYDPAGKSWRAPLLQALTGG